MKRMTIAFGFSFLLFSVEGSPLWSSSTKGAGTNPYIQLNVTLVNTLGTSLSGCDANSLGFEAEGVIQRSGGSVYELPLVNCPVNSLSKGASATAGDIVYATLYNPLTNTYLDGPKHVLTTSDIANGVVNVSVVL